MIWSWVLLILCALCVPLCALRLGKVAGAIVLYVALFLGVGALIALDEYYEILPPTQPQEPKR